MDIKSIKDLKQVIQLCRKTGVSDIEISGIKMHIGPITDYGAKRVNKPLELPIEAYTTVPQYQPPNISTERIERVEEPDALTDEQLLFYSAKAEPQ